MKRYSRSSIHIEDPYSFLALNFFVAVFRTIECYYNNRGSLDDRLEGRHNVNWIRRMQGNFRTLAGAYDGEVEEFHQLCLKKINDIKREAHEHAILAAAKKRIATS